MDEKWLTAETDAKGVRIDKYLSERLPEFSRSYLQKIIKDGNVYIEGKAQKANFKLSGEEDIRLVIPDAQIPDILPEEIPLDILYEDSDIIIVNKPKNMVVHPAPGHYTGTLVNGLMYHCKDQLSGINGVQRPGIVHRIDRNTTGSLVICKNDAAHNAVAAQLKEHTITRKYCAIVHGIVKEDELCIDAPIGRHPVERKKMAIVQKGGRRAVTHVRVLERFKNFTYIECQLETGRTHQIRVHMASIHHPILGDDIYGPAKCPIPGLEGQTLHAQVLGFEHPGKKKYVEFYAPLPAYFAEILEKLRKRS